MHFRIYIFKDPDAPERGFSLKGLKVPLTTFAPVPLTQDMLDLNGQPLFLKTHYLEFWEIPTWLMCVANPQLTRFLRGVDALYVPTEWCQIYPIF